MSEDGAIKYLLSFLMLLVVRSGGSLNINNLSELKGKTLDMGYKLDIKEDCVTVMVEERKLQ
jgi:hypothetical protein